MGFVSFILAIIFSIYGSHIDPVTVSSGCTIGSIGDYVVVASVVDDGCVVSYEKPRPIPQEPSTWGEIKGLYSGGRR